MSNSLLSVRCLGKRFFIAGSGERSGFSSGPLRALSWLANQARRKAGAPAHTRTIQALEDVSFDLMPGETVGIVGDNGAGKSTLLKLLAGVFPPSEGSINISGRMALLIDLGGGVSMDMKVRENIDLLCALTGHTPTEVRAVKRATLAWSGLEDSLDMILGKCAPGTGARLAFALAMNMEADIFLVDEVLSVGDADFREACEERLSSARDRGAAVLLVSHDLTAIQRLCDRVIWLERGRVKAIGLTEEIIADYLRHSIPRLPAGPNHSRLPKPPANIEAPVSITEFSVSGDGHAEAAFDRGGELDFAFDVRRGGVTVMASVDLWLDDLHLATLARTSLSALEPSVYAYTLPLEDGILQPGEYVLCCNLFLPKASKTHVTWKLLQSKKMKLKVTQAASGNSSSRDIAKTVVEGGAC